MTKYEELSKMDSCFNKASDTELIFVLLERDLATPITIRAWCKERVRLGKNTWGDPQIKEAWELASKIQRNQSRYRLNEL